MQIVIDIPEEKIKDPASIDLFYMVGAIKNGTPLPKKHGRLIDFSWIELCLHQKLLRYGIFPQYKQGLELAIKAVDNAPTIIKADSN